jgi:sortase B
MKKVFSFILATILIVTSCALINELINPLRSQNVQAQIISSIKGSNSTNSEGPSEVIISDNLRLMSFDTLKAENSDVAGWLKLSDQNQFPVVQNNQLDAENKYLHTAFDGSNSREGTLYFSSDVNETSDVAIIYGHNMRNGTMFGCLPLYRNLDYVKANPTFELALVSDEVINRYKIVAVCSVSTNYAANDFYYPQANYNSEEEFNEFVRKIKAHSFFVMDDFSYGDKVVILNTCAYGFEGERTIVVGVLDNNSVVNTSTYRTNSERVTPIP